MIVMYKATGDRFHTAMKNAIHRAQPVTITYVRADGEETVRTIEPYEIVETKAGNTIIKAMDRKTGECRSWRIDRVLFYTVHRTRFAVVRDVVLSPKPVECAVCGVCFASVRESMGHDHMSSEIPAVDWDAAWASWNEETCASDTDNEKV